METISDSVNSFTYFRKVRTFSNVYISKLIPDLIFKRSTIKSPKPSIKDMVSIPSCSKLSTIPTTLFKFPVAHVVKNFLKTSFDTISSCCSTWVTVKERSEEHTSELQSRG